MYFSKNNLLTPNKSPAGKKRISFHEDDSHDRLYPQLSIIEAASSRKSPFTRLVLLFFLKIGLEVVKFLISLFKYIVVLTRIFSFY